MVVLPAWTGDTKHFILPGKNSKKSGNLLTDFILFLILIMKRNQLIVLLGKRLLSWKNEEIFTELI
jgi:hypothetical protein